MKKEKETTSQQDDLLREEVRAELIAEAVADGREDIADVYRNAKPKTDNEV